MDINTSKPKEMIIEMIINVARPSQSAAAMITVDNCPIERVSTLKLLGVTISTDLRWSCHIKELCAKVNKRLHFLKLLKRSAMTTDDLLHHYKTVIRQVIVYVCPVWQSSLTVDELRKLGAIQKRAISGSNDYELDCSLYDLEPLQTRLDKFSRKLYSKISQPNDCLNKLLPRRELESGAH